jgi:HSP20 family protein
LNQGKNHASAKSRAGHSRRYDMKTLDIYRPTIQNALCDFDRYFESFFGDSILAPSARIFNKMPSVDIQETEKSYVLDMELPGFDEKNIEIHIDGSNLTISSKIDETTEKKNEGRNYLLRERRQNSFIRSFKLPENTDPEAVSAVFKNGILTMEINKRAETQKRTIMINAS